jgi:magnesium and cobalt transporter
MVGVRAVRETMDGTDFNATPRDGDGSRVNGTSEDDGQPSSSWVTRLLNRVMVPAEGDADEDDGQGENGMAALARRAAAEQRAMLLNIIRMRDQRVEDVMIPRADIVAAPEAATLEELVQVFRDASLTRVPVFRETLDDPIGFVHLKDIAFEYGFGNEGNRPAFAIARHLRQPLYVPPSMTTAKLLERMQTSRKHIALIIDEYGGVDGLVTIEDLVEQIVGEIDDEHDDADPAPWRQEAPGVYIANARTDIAEFEKAVGVKLVSDEDAEELDTLGGLVFMLSNRVPERGEVIAHPDGYEFEVIDADPRRIKRLRVNVGQRPANPA